MMYHVVLKRVQYCECFDMLIRAKWDLEHEDLPKCLEIEGLVGHDMPNHQDSKMVDA